MFASRFDTLPSSPFPRLTSLLADTAPGADPVDMAIGEPKHAPPAFVKDIIAEHFSDFTRYPPALGSTELRAAIAAWSRRRYGIGELIDPERNLVPLCGTREGLFGIALVTVPEWQGGTRNAVLIPNPFYQCYATAAVAAGAEPVYLPTSLETNFLPDLDAIDRDLLDRTSLFYLCTPANPQGTVASLDYIKRLVSMAREHDFTVLFDECYSEIYLDTPPPGALQAAADLGDGLANVLSFNSLSKRSSLAGLRSGVCMGDPDIVASFLKFRNLAAPQLAYPIQAASAAVWSDEDHVIENRALYQGKIRSAQQILGEDFGFYAPPGGFFLWLDMSEFGGGEQAAQTLWRKEGIRVLPGSYLARPEPDAGDDPYGKYVRIALVHDLETCSDVLRRMAAVFAAAA